MIEENEEIENAFIGQYKIKTDATYIDDRTQVLNHHGTFAILNRSGDILPLGEEFQGIYYEDTRYVNGLKLHLNNHSPTLLSSNIKEENEILSVDLTNPKMLFKGEWFPQGIIHIHRSQLVRDGHFHEKIEIENHNSNEHTCELTLDFDGDFKDIFEVRGVKREKRGEFLGFEYPDKNTIIMSYLGLDQVVRRCKITFNQAFSRLSQDGEIKYDLKLFPKKFQKVEYTISFLEGEEQSQIRDYHTDKSAIESDIEKSKNYLPIIETANEQFTHWLNRSKADLVSLMSDTPTGKYPYAGVPWYNTAFGRDGIITALETLWAAPKLSRDVLLYLASNQAEELDEANDAEPGKILHETRGGEMVALNEIPFKKYYGTNDATPLFLILAGEYYVRTGDISTIKQIWPNIIKAIHWINEYGDLDGDGYVEYQHKSKNGLTNQGWKDSHDSVSHANGQLAEPAIALCEIQGYVYSAKLHVANLAMIFEERELSKTLRAEAKILKEKFNEDFWDKQLGCYVIALDGRKKPCRVKSSNAGQVLYTGIADPGKAKRLVQSLMRPDMFSGWGIRTLSDAEIRFNPMSYHNGSVWPHDVALIAEGMGRYGYQEQSLELMTGLFDASLFIQLQRLPELFCGMERREGEGPTAYPVACSPQAWSVAAVYMLLQSILQIKINNLKKEVSFCKPILPEYIESMNIKNLDLGDVKVDIELTRHGRNNMISINWNLDDTEWQLSIIK
ncbi:MAG: amylo-alpha-1,6-glucosidase [Bacteroidota bacterium]